jgi:hypothetical protein
MIFVNVAATERMTEVRLSEVKIYLRSVGFRGPAA